MLEILLLEVRELDQDGPQLIEELKEFLRVILIFEVHTIIDNWVQIRYFQIIISDWNGILEQALHFKDVVLGRNILWRNIDPVGFTLKPLVLPKNFVYLPVTGIVWQGISDCWTKNLIRDQYWIILLVIRIRHLFTLVKAVMLRKIQVIGWNRRIK